MKKNHLVTDVSSKGQKNQSLENVSNAADIFKKHEDFICSVIYSHLSNKNLAQDIFQDLFLSLVSRPIDPNMSGFRRYLFRAINNDIIDATRKVKSYKNCVHQFNEYKKYTTPRDNNPAKLICNKEESEHLFKIIDDNLPNAEARAIKHRFKDGFTIEETAEKMKIKKRSVSRYASVGIKKLRLFFQALEEDDDDHNT